MKRFLLPMSRKSLVLLGILFALGTLGAPPAMAHNITTAQVSTDCTGFTIEVAGTGLTCISNPNKDVVTYSITLTPTGGRFSYQDHRLNPDDVTRYYPIPATRLPRSTPA